MRQGGGERKPVREEEEEVGVCAARVVECVVDVKHPRRSGGG